MFVQNFGFVSQPTDSISNKIQYKLYTDARNYLRTDSFHPNHVFNSAAFSQMLRVANQNSKEDTRKSDIKQLKSDLHRSGHGMMAKLDNLEGKVRGIVEYACYPRRGVSPRNHGCIPRSVFLRATTVTLLKTVLQDIESVVEALLGPSKIIVASENGCSIDNNVLRNSSVCRAPTADSSTSNWVQRCNAPRCLTCKHMCKAGDVFVINV